MWTMEELMELKTPFLTMQDITKKDWEHLDFELEKYDIAKEEYDLDGCKVLAFVLQQIHYNKMNFNEVPNFIRNGRQFQEYEDKWQQCLTALEYDYTLSFRSACKILKCDRSWVQKYIRPNVHYIYLSTGAGRKTTSYTKLASKAINKELTESIWFNTKEFDTLIRKSISSCTRQTILVPVEHLIAADKLSDFLTEYKKLKTEKEACDPVKDILKRIEIIQSMDKLIQASVNTIGKEIYSNLPSCYKRGACPVVKCNLPEFQLADIISVHDLKDYGDCDEEIYRQLFLDGCYRLEINIPGENGILSKKIYYLKPEPPKNSIELIPISYHDFLKWKL